MSCTITVEEFKTLFDRGQFQYGTDLPSIRDKDITEAIEEAEAVFNGDLYPSESECKRALSYLTAHFLTLDVSGGNSGGQPTFNQTSRSADGISEAVHVPEWAKEGDFAMYATTSYGVKYLMLSKPYLDGAVLFISGRTQF